MQTNRKNCFPMTCAIIISLLSLISIRASGDDAQPQLAASYSPDELDNTLARIPAGSFLFGMTDQEKQTAAKEAGVHPDMLHHHSNRQLLTTKEFWFLDDFSGMSWPGQVK